MKTPIQIENQDAHHESDEEIQGTKLNDLEKALIDDSYACDYEWEKELQELWRKMDEALEEMKRVPQETNDALEEVVCILSKGCTMSIWPTP